MATVHFPHVDQSPVYQDRIRSWVKGNVTACPKSLFVFDEVDKMPPGVLDGIRAYLDHFDNVDGFVLLTSELKKITVLINLSGFLFRVDYRRSIFIFLSNTGGKEIVKKVHDVWQGGRVKREQLGVRDFEDLVELGAYNEEGYCL